MSLLPVSNTSQPTPLLELKNLHKSFGSKIVHQGVSFSLYPGEILALFGGSGSGKSVILRSIIGLEKPDQGEIFFQGLPLTGRSERNWIPIRTQISYVFQNGALFDSLTVEENLSYPLQEHTQLNPEQILEKVNQMLEFIDLKGSNVLYPNELSGGMQKRVGLGRAMILNPQMTLFDEPTAGLDPANTKRLINNIKKLKQNKMTGIFVTHDIPSAFELADRIAVLYQGVIYATGTPQSMKLSKDPIIRSFVDGIS